jgi:ribosomal protein S18 acetylase RimI-like enzyme
VQVRRARARDLAELVRMNVAADADNHELVPDVGGRRIDRRRARHYWKHALRNPRALVLVAVRGLRAEGLIAADLVVLRSRLAPVRRYVYLHSLWVEPAARRAGLARALTRAALTWAVRRGARQARLEAAANNTHAQRLYRELGFALREVMMARPL